MIEYGLKVKSTVYGYGSSPEARADVLADIRHFDKGRLVFRFVGPWFPVSVDEIDQLPMPLVEYGTTCTPPGWNAALDSVRIWGDGERGLTRATDSRRFGNNVGVRIVGRAVTSSWRPASRPWWRFWD